jgi:hypothetical protein
MRRRKIACESFMSTFTHARAEARATYSSDSAAVLFWCMANPAMAALIGFTLDGAGGAALGLGLGIGLVTAPSVLARAPAWKARLWAGLRPHVATGLQRFAAYLPTWLLRTFDRRGHS